MKNTSIWLDGIRKQKFRKLEKDIDVDVLIVGGGITGVSSAYHLSTSLLEFSFKCIDIKFKNWVAIKFIS